MRPGDARGHVPLARPLLVALALGACTSAVHGPQPIAVGTPCHVCGMEIQNLRFACERESEDGLRFYDAIECLLRDDSAVGDAWLADYDTRSIHAADSLWIVRGDIPSPMGGGYAAFLDRASAEDVATQAGGEVLRFAELAGAAELPVSTSEGTGP